MKIQNFEDTSNVNETSELKEIVDLAMEAGRILLKSRAEIFRAEETIKRICNNFGVEKVELFTLSHGIFVTAEGKNHETYTKITPIPNSETHLGVVSEVNSLSREIAEGKVSKEEAKVRLKEINRIKSRSYLQFFGAGLGAFGLGVTVGANLYESVIAGIMGLAGQTWVYLAQKMGCNNVIKTIGAAMVTTIMGVIICCIPGLPHLRILVTMGAAVMPLVPGVAFTNSIRDTADGDILSGTVRMINALMTFVYIGVGAGVVLQFYTTVLGGTIL